ncbi:MAG TPA: hypothetical protein VNY08_01610 [Bradyrhizobium sp.]|nr:hypothetical protein [Bradyrhizobium sp.]
MLYVGQAIGSFVGGLFHARELLYGLGFVAMAFVALAVMLVITSQPRPASAVYPIHAPQGLANRPRPR